MTIKDCNRVVVYGTWISEHEGFLGLYRGEQRVKIVLKGLPILGVTTLSGEVAGETLGVIFPPSLHSERQGP